MEAYLIDSGLSRETLVAIVEKSAFLHERFAPQFVLRSFDASDEDTLEQVRQWSDRIAESNETRFQKRFEWDGLSRAQVERAVTGVTLRDSYPLPRWASLLGQALGHALASSVQSLETPESTGALPQSSTVLPFAHLTACFLQCGVHQVKARTTAGWNNLAPAAQNSLRHQLVARLCASAQETLMIEFELYRTLQGNGIGWLRYEGQTGLPQRELYASFVDGLLNGRLGEFFNEYSVLGRMLAQLTLQWIGSTCEFLERLLEDAQDIATRLAEQKSLGGVSNIEAGLSDPHNAGRTVLKVQFDSGYSCIYKPRNLDLEDAYYKLLTWFNDHGAPLPFCIFKGIYRAQYGWVEIVSPEACSDAEAVRRFYSRAGMLLCLMFVLEGCDCHAQNLVAHGEFPVLVDTEALLQPGIGISDLGQSMDATSVAGQAFFSDSVFRVGLLPRWISRRGRSESIGGLGIGGSAPSKVRVRSLENVNTDAMSWQTVEVATEDSTCVCKLGEEVTAPQNYVDQIVQGFEGMYGCLLTNADALLAPTGSCLSAFDSLRSRFLFRSTNHYYDLQAKAFGPLPLRNGLDVNIHLDALYRRFLRADDRPPAWGIIRAEQEALLIGDIPMFSSEVSDGTLQAGDGTLVQGILLTPPLDNVRSHIRRLSHTKLRLQSAYIRSAFRQIPAYQPSTPRLKVNAVLSTEVLTTAELISEAVTIAEKIRSVSIRVNDTATWITRAYDPDAHSWQMQPMVPRLYDGVCGPALFLSALERAAPGSGFRELGLAALKTVSESRVRGVGQRCDDELGGGLGVASVVYSLVTAGQLLGDERLMDEAEKFAQMISAKRIEADTWCDLLRGSAGVLACLHALYRIRPRSWVLNLMRACGVRLLDQQQRGAAGGAAWETINGKMLCSFSHGAAGIAFALSQLADRTGDSRYLQAAGRGEQYENALFSTANENWPDLLAEGNATKFRNAWCHGAAGIVLGRVHTAVGGALDEFTEAGLRTLENELLSPLDHLCCGNLGRTDVLLEAGRRLGRPELVLKARQLATAVVMRARQTGDYQLGVPDGLELASFHQGLAGIGYQLLRLAAPDQVPCALAWQ